MSNTLYLSYDGDGCGKKVGRAIMANDEHALHEWSAKIDLGHEIVNHWVAEHGGKRISGGGDEGAFKLPEHAAEQIEELRKDYFYATNITISVGIGKSLSEAGRSLLAAKFRGKDQVAWYGDDVEKDISNARKKVKKGKASQEEYKLAEAYLEKSEGDPMNHDNCPYCAVTDGVDPNHCKYCHDQQPDTGHDDCPYCKTDDVGNPDSHADCPYCKGTDQSGPAGADCPYCKDDAASGQKQPEVASMDDHAAQQESSPHIRSADSSGIQPAPGSPDEQAAYGEMGMNPPGIPKPQVGDGGGPAGIGMANPGDATGATVQPPNADPAEQQANNGLPPEDAQSKEALQAIAQQIEGQTVDGKPAEAQVAQNIDDTSVIGNGMEGNVSRPSGYSENTPGDMGLDEQHASDDEGSPDFSSVLKEGLDDQADDIEKDKVRDMVGNALQGFKASKQILENAKTQAPQFYQASIAMLASMIKMAEMLGLAGQKEEAQVAGIATWDNPFPTHPDNGGPGAAAGAGGEDWQNPFPKHPDQGGERKPGHSAGKGDESSTVGQPIGKLPSKATQHVARTPMPPGAVNAKGQQKVIDPKTGDTRFIDRKQGMVQSTTGVPIKPPSKGTEEKKPDAPKNKN